MDKIIDFFLKNKDQVVDYFNQIYVNHYKTTIKYGYIENEGLSIAFYIHHEADLSITDFTEKIKCLFNAEIPDINELEEFLGTNKPCKISFTPFLKINDEPIIHAFQMNLNYLV